MVQVTQFKRQGGLCQQNCDVSLQSFLRTKLSEQFVHLEKQLSYQDNGLLKRLIFRPWPSF